MLEKLGSIFGLNLSHEVVAKLRSELPALIDDLNPTEADARLVSIILDGTLNTVVEKFIEAVKEFEKYDQLTAPLRKSGKESKQEREIKAEAKQTTSSARLFVVPTATVQKTGVIDSLKKNFSDFKQKIGR